MASADSDPALAAGDIGDFSRLKKGIDGLNYLLDNWVKETTVCNPECNRSPDSVRFYLGRRSTEHPLYKIEVGCPGARSEDPSSLPSPRASGPRRDRGVRCSGRGLEHGHLPSGSDGVHQHVWRVSRRGWPGMLGNWFSHVFPRQIQSGGRQGRGREVPGAQQEGGHFGTGFPGEDH
eukprot:scaffold7340_cov266-Pinguiococcus_pyrenoidosus.AAC.2